MQAKGIPGLSGSCPEIYREKAFASQGHPVLPIARELGETSIMLLVHPTLTEIEIEKITTVVRDVCLEATR
jgi:dTDP-4-amino-4,6-dideoxygalactose transaminase